ncbi:MAG: hypothetical protein VB066_12410, partial [Paludibacter sp.]|nr:hypothetical protein [Paludibacter sp.]
MNIGLIGFGKTGRAVASVILQHDKFKLCWVLRKSGKQENRAISEILEIDCDNDGMVYSLSNHRIDQFLDQHPVDIIIDFSSEGGIYEYG